MAKIIKFKHLAKAIDKYFSGSFAYMYCKWSGRVVPANTITRSSEFINLPVCECKVIEKKWGLLLEFVDAEGVKLYTYCIEWAFPLADSVSRDDLVDVCSRSNCLDISTVLDKLPKDFIVCAKYNQESKGLDLYRFNDIYMAKHKGLSKVASFTRDNPVGVLLIEGVGCE